MEKKEKIKVCSICGGKLEGTSHIYGGRYPRHIDCSFNTRRVFRVDELEQEIEKAREEGRREVLEDMRKMWDNDNLGDAPKYGSAGAGLMKRWIRDDINERLSKLTTK